MQIKKIIKLFLITTILLCLNNYSAKSINFDETLENAIKNSFDLKAAQINTKISKTDIGKAKASYYPKLQGGINSQYSEDLRNQQNDVISVGSTTFGTIRYQNLAYLGLNYNVFDFGKRKNQLNIATKDFAQKQVELFQEKRDLTIQIIELYTQALFSYKTISTQKEILNTQNETFKIKERLYNAGKISKIELTEAAIKITRTLDEINKQNSGLKNTLNKLAYFTGENYTENTPIEDFKEMPKIENNDIDIENTPEFKKAQLEINKKMEELAIAKKKYLPQFQLFSSYNLYGDDNNNFIDAVDSIKPRSFNAGFNATIPIFDGFETSNEIKKIQLELQKLENEKAKQISEYKTRLNNAYIDYALFDEEYKIKQELLSKINNKLNMIERLFSQQMIEKELLYEIKTELLDLKLKVENAVIQKISSAKKIQILSQML